MKTGAAYLIASAQIDREMRALLAETPAPPPHNERGLGQHETGLHETPHPQLIHDLVEMGHFVLSGVAPYPLVATRRCKPANDDHLISASASSISEEIRAGAKSPPNPLDYLPGPLRQSVIQLLASTAIVALPELCTPPSTERHRPDGLKERFGRAQRALRSSAKQIAHDVGTAGLGDIIVEIIGILANEIDVVCERLLRALRHSILPIIQALRALIIPDPKISYRDSVDSAIRLFVQAGIVGSCVLIEQQIDILLHKIFPAPYVGFIITCFMAFMCVIALKKAMQLLDRADPVGARQHRELARQIEALRLQGRDFDRRLNGLLIPGLEPLEPLRANKQRQN